MKKILYGIALAAIVVAVRWAEACVLVLLLSLCFDFTFTLKVGTGVWLALEVAQNLFDPKKRKINQ